MPYSHRLIAQLRKVAKLHTKVERVREYHHRKIACQLEKTYRLVDMEEHGIQFMIQNRRTARSAADRGIAAFKKIVGHKLGMRYVATANQRKGIGGNSQTCICGAPVPKELGDRIHDCPQCGLIADRDVVSANIVELIAFGTTHLQTSSRGAGQVLRHGGAEGRAEHSVTAESAERRVSEASLKRPPPAFCERRKTMGAEATMGVDTSRHPQQRLSGETPSPEHLYTGSTGLQAGEECHKMACNAQPFSKEDGGLTELRANIGFVGIKAQKTNPFANR